MGKTAQGLGSLSLISYMETSNPVKKNKNDPKLTYEVPNIHISVCMKDILVQTGHSFLKVVSILQPEPYSKNESNLEKKRKKHTKNVIFTCVIKSCRYVSHGNFFSIAL